MVAAFYTADDDQLLDNYHQDTQHLDQQYDDQQYPQQHQQGGIYSSYLSDQQNPQSTYETYVNEAAAPSQYYDPYPAAQGHYDNSYDDTLDQSHSDNGSGGFGSAVERYRQQDEMRQQVASPYLMPSVPAPMPTRFGLSSSGGQRHPSQSSQIGGSDLESGDYYGSDSQDHYLLTDYPQQLSGRMSPFRASPTPTDFAGEDYTANTYRLAESVAGDNPALYPQYYYQDYEQNPDTFINGDGYQVTMEPTYMQADMPPEPIYQKENFKSVDIAFEGGNFVFDFPVPGSLASKSDRGEFKHLRYSAVTVEPGEFVDAGFTLRQMKYSPKRETVIFIVITIYNEDDILLARTLKGVFENIYHLCNLKPKDNSEWGPTAWKRVVVCIVADGRAKVNPRALALLTALGCYQDNSAKGSISDKDGNATPVHAHLFEYTTRIGIEKIGKTVELVDIRHIDEKKRNSKRKFPVQLMFCLKEENKKKINSHRWFFDAFSRTLQPEVCVLLDAGTKPTNDSLYYLWREFNLDPTVGGACGEIRADLGNNLSRQIFTAIKNPLVASQNFEYKMSNILDKPLESSFGFISVLPGAFSAYRYRAIQNDERGLGPLEKYYKGETMHAPTTDDDKTGKYKGPKIFDSNMYLAEDRILCYELVTKRNCNWKLRYVKEASASTDVPDKLDELILQRRRWLNGSFFAALYALFHQQYIWRSSHSFWQKIMFHVEFVYQAASIAFSWFGLANFFLVFRILVASLGDSSLGFAPGKVLGVIFEWLYIGCLFICFILSFGNKPKGTKRFYVAIVCIFAVIMAYLMFAVIYITIKSIAEVKADNDGSITFLLFVTNSTLRGVAISLASTYVLYIWSSFCFFEFGHLFHSFLQYLLLSPSYINVLNVYAFCNIHDVSWGTKGDTGHAASLGTAVIQADGKAQVAIIFEEEKLNDAYQSRLNELNTVPVAKAEVVNQKDRLENYYALSRTWVVVTWAVSNFALVAIVLRTAGVERLDSDDDTSSKRLLRRDSDDETEEELISTIYLEVVLYSVAVLAFIRFIGAMVYLCGRRFRSMRRR
ncbi:chitin synthase-domain-containing protein [Limtongia smithiae]|uniref:chitin synthase-domain-containing protein n=1 Tax=Limtongia smithiae TaxID=1125753 RepID=UPI0034CE9C9B